MGFHIRSGEGVAIEPIDQYDSQNLITRGWYFSPDGSLTAPNNDYYYARAYIVLNTFPAQDSGFGLTTPDGVTHDFYYDYDGITGPGTPILVNPSTDTITDVANKTITVLNASGLFGDIHWGTDLNYIWVYQNVAGETGNQSNYNYGNDGVSSFTGGEASRIIFGDGTIQTTAPTSDTYLLDRTYHTGTQSYATITGLGTLATQDGTFSDTVNIGETQIITGAKEFTLSPIVPRPTESNHAVNKAYADDISAGLHVHEQVHVILTIDLATATGGTVAYTNGTDGVGAKLTVTGGSTIITALNAECGEDDDLVAGENGSRVIINGEVDNKNWNGIYIITADRELTRAADFDSSIEMAGGDFVFVTHGTTYADTGWVLSEPVTTVGSSNVEFVQFSGSGSYDAGDGLHRDGTIFSVVGTADRIVVGPSVDLASHGTAGTYQSVTTDAYGRVTSGTNPTTLSGYGITDAASATSVSNHISDDALHLTSVQNTLIDGITVTSTKINYLSDVTSAIQSQLDGKSSTSHIHSDATTSIAGFMSTSDKTKLDAITGTNTGDQTITLTGDITGSGTGSFATTLKDTGPGVGTYQSVTIDTKGRVTAGTNPTTLSGYGIIDAAASTDLSNHISDETKHLTSAQNTLIDAITVTSAEINHLTDVTSNVQSQINSKSSTSHTHDNATTVIDGFMSAGDKTKLDAINGTMATQNANAVAITGGTITGLSSLTTANTSIGTGVGANITGTATSGTLLRVQGTAGSGGSIFTAYNASNVGLRIAESGQMFAAASASFSGGPATISLGGNNNTNVIRSSNSTAAATSTDIVLQGGTVDRTAGNLFQVRNNTNSVITVTAVTGGGNVGIGTTTPSEKLSVSGNVSVTGSISATNIGTISSKNYTQSVSAPASPAEGDQWLRTDTLQKYEYYNSAWVSAGGSQPDDSNTIIGLSLFL